ncbi:hypothetical protein [Micromonospora thermarum]|uniref:hypothetical protein n=1 Tax=Micromonospora thermarum TaxID=2720024 RepID=UPI00197C6720|nr:hypothetical protein [Micromonospora thermarum]
MEVRDAAPDDWPGIWPFLREIVAAGETYTWPRDVDEERARRRGILVAPVRAGDPGPVHQNGGSR